MLTNLSTLMEGFSFRSNERRQDFRHLITCDALLNVCFRDFQDDLAVKISNISDTGALLYTDQVYVGHRHLISIDYPPMLNLKIKLPEEYFESPVEIRWYKWAVEQNCFEIGVHFILMFEEARIAVNKFISKVKCGADRLAH